MDLRTKILAVVFGAALAYLALSAVVYPRWIEPILTIEDQIAERQRVLDTLEEGEAEVERAKDRYLSYLNRVGSFDPVVVENDLRERLNRLIDKHQLADQNVTGRHSGTNRKTNISDLVISITAAGRLDSCVGFLKDIAELPHLLQIGNVTIYPVSSSRGEKAPDRVNLRVPIDVRILPQHTMLGRKWKDDELTRPERLARCEGRDYGMIAEREPFAEYIPPKPLVALAGRNMSIDAGAAAVLQGKVTGGVGQHTISWIPAEELDDPASLTPRVTDTSQVGERMFTISVSDEAGNSSSATVTLTIREAPKVVDAEPEVEPEVETEVKPAGPKRWPDRKYMRSKMALIHTEGDTRVGELLIYDVKSKESSYYTTGDEFDGGQLLYVHPRGALVRRLDEYFVYPIGAGLEEDLPVDEAVDFPRLQAVAEWFESAQAKATELQNAAEGAGPDGVGEGSVEGEETDREGGAGRNGGEDAPPEDPSQRNKATEEAAPAPDAPTDGGNQPDGPTPNKPAAKEAGTKTDDKVQKPSKGSPRPSRKTRATTGRKAGRQGKKIVPGKN